MAQAQVEQGGGACGGDVQEGCEHGDGTGVVFGQEQPFACLDSLLDLLSLSFFLLLLVYSGLRHRQIPVSTCLR